MNSEFAKGIRFMAHNGRKVYRSKSRRRSSGGAGKKIIFVLFILCIIVVAYVATGWIFSIINSSGSGDAVSSQTSSVLEDDTEAAEETAEAAEEETSDETAVTQTSYTAVTMPQTVLLDSTQWQTFLDSAKAQGYTAVTVTLKDGQGALYYNSSVSRAVSNGAVVSGAVDAAQLCQAIQDSGLTPIAQMGCFVDRYGSIGSDATFTSGGTRLWQGTPNAESSYAYLDPYTDVARTYLVQIAQEIAAAGFQTILLDDVVFPTGNVYTSTVLNQHNTTGATQTEILAQFVQEVQAGIASVGATAIPVADALSYLGIDATAYGGTSAGLSTDMALTVDFASLTGANAVAGYETLDTTGILTQLVSQIQAAGGNVTLVISEDDYAAQQTLLSSMNLAGIVVS